MRLYCDSACPTCYHQRSKDIYQNGKNKFYFCRKCRLSYLCSLPLKRKISIKREYYCSVCSSTLVEVPLWRSYSLGLSTKVVPRISRGTMKKNVWDIKEEVTIKDLITYWSKKADEQNLEEKSVEKQVEELLKVEELNEYIVLDLISKSDIDTSEININSEIDELLLKVAEIEPFVISLLYDTLIVKSSLIDRIGIQLILLTKQKLFNAAFMSSNVTSELEGTIDLYSVNKQTGKITWFAISDEPLEETRLSALMNQILSIHPLNFANVEKIYLASQKTTWTIPKILKKRKFINTISGKVNLGLLVVQNIDNHEIEIIS